MYNVPYAVIVCSQILRQMLIGISLQKLSKTFSCLLQLHSKFQVYYQVSKQHIFTLTFASIYCCMGGADIYFLS